MDSSYPRVLTIAGSDSGGGAGIQADIKAISACGSYASSAITAVTSQNTVGVQDILPLPTSHVVSQIRSVLDDIGTDAVKIGMLHDREVIVGVTSTLKEYSDIHPIVLDPVMVSTSGDSLILDDAVEALKENLISLCTIMTPNLYEGKLLAGVPASSHVELEALSVELANMFGVSVLLKGGHSKENIARDFLFEYPKKKMTYLESPRVTTSNLHGTGCTLSSALASLLAQGADLATAAKKAKSYLYESLKSGASHRIGKGSGPVDHFYHLKSSIGQHSHKPQAQ